MSVVKALNFQIGQSVTATNNFTWYQPASPDGTVRLGNGNSGSVTDLVTLTSAGNLGIGTSSPGYRLDVANTARLSQGLLIQGSNLSATASQVTIDQLSSTVSRLIAWGPNTTTPGILYLGNLSSNATAGSASNLVLDSSGNLGLGVTPSAWGGVVPRAFELPKGVAIASQSNTTAAHIVSNVYYDGAWKYYGTGVASRFVINPDGAAGFAWYTAPSGTAGNAISFTQAMTLDASGNLVVGDTATVSGARFYAKSSGNNIVARFYGPGLSDSNTTVYFDKPSTTNTTSQVFVAFSINGQATGSGQINANGASAAAFGSFSDARLKENITALPNQLANICALKPSEFDYKDGSGHQIGFIAQEMQEVYPDVVGEGEDGMLTITGWSKTEARLVKAIQELSAQVSDLKTELNELKQKVNA